MGQVPAITLTQRRTEDIPNAMRLIQILASILRARSRGLVVMNLRRISRYTLIRWCSFGINGMIRCSHRARRAMWVKIFCQMRHNTAVSEIHDYLHRPICHSEKTAENYTYCTASYCRVIRGSRPGQSTRKDLEPPDEPWLCTPNLALLTLEFKTSSTTFTVEEYQDMTSAIPQYHRIRALDRRLHGLLVLCLRVGRNGKAMRASVPVRCNLIAWPFGLRQRWQSSDGIVKLRIRRVPDGA